MRDTIARLIAPVMRLTGFRFSKVHRHNEDLIYRMVNVVKANILASK